MIILNDFETENFNKIDENLFDKEVYKQTKMVDLSNDADVYPTLNFTIFSC